jgi:hypothetical protein
LLDFTVLSTDGLMIALSHEGVVAGRRIEGGDWTPLAEASAEPRAARQE